ncbi:hypothetical protein PSP6_30049 [Paraburkholderia tropica]|nr:hypothetical protein PSP6_30049 [Paraburkholderia tropica]
MAAEIASSAVRMFARSRSLARCAASPAHSVSRLMRNSSTESRSLSVLAGTTSSSSGSRRGSSTKLPMPCRVSITDMACRREMASRTTVRLTPSWVMRLLSVGSLSPGFNARDPICSLMKWTTCSARLRVRVGMGAASDTAIVPSLSFGLGFYYTSSDNWRFALNRTPDDSRFSDPSVWITGRAVIRQPCRQRIRAARFADAHRNDLRAR